MLEVGLSPIVSKEAENCWKAIQNFLGFHGEAAECFDIAPKGDLERRIEATLKGLKIYGNETMKEKCRRSGQLIWQHPLL